MSTSETGASSVIWTSDIINSPKKRYEKVKEEKQRRIKEWIASMAEIQDNIEKKISYLKNKMSDKINKPGICQGEWDSVFGYTTCSVLYKGKAEQYLS